MTPVIESSVPTHNGWLHGRRFKRVAFAVAVVAALSVGVAVYRAKEASRETGWTMLTSGTYRGVPWRLDASLSGGMLCMQLDGPKGPNDPSNETNGYPGACGFNDRFAIGTYYDGGLGPAGHMVQFGPLPSQAKSIRLAPHLVVPSHPLPRGLKGGNYWIEIFPDAAPQDTPQPLDAQGRPVAFTAF